MNKLFIAMVAHEVNRAYCASIGDFSQPTWGEAPEWQKDSAVKGVDALLANAEHTPEEMHALWMVAKEAEGWKFGPLKDPKTKEHPCMVPYDQLAPAQRTKDYLFKAIVNTLADLPSGQMPGVVPNQPMPPVIKGMVPIKYVGTRETYREGAYGTGIIFSKGQTQLVPAAKAALLLRHPDVYAPGDLAEAPAEIVNKAFEDASKRLDKPKGANPPETETETLDLEAAHQSIATMNRAAMANFAKVNFNVEVDAKLPAAEVRSKVKLLIDQFGLPGSEKK